MLRRVLRCSALADSDPSETSARASILNHALTMSVLCRLIFIDHSAHISHARIAVSLPIGIALTTQVDLPLKVTPRVIASHVL